jgi:hypothetical protein
MTVTLSPLAGAGWQFFDNSGQVLTGGKLYTYAAGTTTPLETYTTINGNVANSNPIVLDAAGRVPYEIWISLGVGYKFILKDTNDVQIASWDNIPSNAASPFANDASGIAYEQGNSVTAGSFIVGQSYLITSIGTTNFVAIGAATNTVGTYFTATGVGSGTGTALTSMSVQSKLREYVSVKDFGAIGNGVADDTVAIENATNQSQFKRIFFPAGTYKITRQLNITVNSYSWVGERTERGMNARNLAALNGDVFPAVLIKFRPGNTTSFIVNKYVASSTGAGLTGPFEHTDLYFDINTDNGGANGFQFGNESLPIVDGPGQLYVFGVRFINCSFDNAGGSFASATDGTMNLPGNRSIGIAKGFECVIEDTDISGGDYGIRTYGCDKFNSTRTRVYCLRPYDLIRSGTFGQQHTIYDLQSEGWALSPVRNAGVTLDVTNSSFENNIGTNVGAGKYVLPTCTATVTANSPTLTFSRSMDNILIPGWSIITVTDGTNTDTCFVTAVSGTTVTVSTATFRFTWSGTATTITRIHNYGPIHTGSTFRTDLTGISPGAALDCPSFVYVGGGGVMNITSAGDPGGTNGDIQVLAIGNMYAGQFVMNGQMVLNNCNTITASTLVHPLIRVINQNEWYGRLDQDNQRIGSADKFHSFNKAFRKWIYTPATSATAQNNNYYVTYKQVQGDTGTSQQNWSWYLDSSLVSSPAGGRNLFIIDATLPSATSGGLKIVMRAKAKSGTANVNFVCASSLGGTSVADFAVGTSWTTFTAPIAIPAIWGSSAANRSLNISSDADVYIEMVTVVDDNPTYVFDYTDNTVGKSLAHNAKTLTFGAAATNIFTATGATLQSYKVKAYCTVNDASGYYATVYAEYMVQVSVYGGTTTVQGVSSIYKQAQSINSGVYAVDIVIAASAAAGVVTITAAATKTGAGSATVGNSTFEVEAMGLGYSPITVV